MKQLKNEKKNTGRFLSMLLDTLDANLMENLVPGKTARATSQGQFQTKK